MIEHHGVESAVAGAAATRVTEVAEAPFTTNETKRRMQRRHLKRCRLLRHEQQFHLLSEIAGGVQNQERGLISLNR